MMMHFYSVMDMAQYLRKFEMKTWCGATMEAVRVDMVNAAVAEVAAVGTTVVVVGAGVVAAVAVGRGDLVGKYVLIR